LSFSRSRPLKRYKSCLIVLVFFFSFIITPLFTPFAHVEELKIGGVGSALGSMKLLAAAFEKKNPGIKVTVLTSLGSIGGIQAVSKGAIDIGLTGRPLNEKEQKFNPSVTAYAITPVIFVTRNNINVATLDEKEIINIFKGETEKWPGGERIRMILRQLAETNAVAINQISPEMSKAMDIAMSRPWRIVALTDQETMDIAEKTPGAFTFCTLAQVLSENRKVKILSYNGVPPLLDNRPNEAYPIFKIHAMVTQHSPSLPVQRFIDFVKSREARAILEANGDIQITVNKGK
jgi:phosphate transport system substrate-binding protein